MTTDEMIISQPLTFEQIWGVPEPDPEDFFGFLENTRRMEITDDSNEEKE